MPKITVNSYEGGISPNPESLQANQFALGQGLDISTPHILTINQKLKAVGDTELLKAVMVGQKGYGIGSDVAQYPDFTSSNGVYSWSNGDNTWYFLTTYTGNTGLFSAVSFGQYLLSCDVGYLHQSHLPFNATATHSSQVGTFTGTATIQNHPIFNEGTYVYIGNGSRLSKYDLTTFTDDVLPLGSGYCITDINGDGNYIILLCKSIHGGSPDIVYWWDGYSEHWNYKIDLPFTSECLGKIDNVLVVFGDQNGSVYQIAPTGYSKIADSVLLREQNIPSHSVSTKATIYSYSNVKHDLTAYLHATANKAVDGLDAWLNPTNAYSSNNQYATTTTQDNPYHIWYDFKDGATTLKDLIPVGATINGIEVKVEAKILNTTTGSLNIRLTKNKNDYIGTDNNTPYLTTSDVVYSWGGITDLWGTSWTRDDLGTNFGIRIAPNYFGGTIVNYVDDIQIKVYYTYTPSEPVSLGVKSINAISAVTNFKNKLLFAPQYGNILYGGIWSIGKNNENLAVNYEWRIGDGTVAVYSINNRYPLPNTPPNLYVCCAGGTTKVLEIDYSNKVTDAYYESLRLDAGSPTITKRFDFITINTKPLSASCSILIKKKVNEETDWVTVGTYSGTGKTKQTFPIPNSNIGANIQIRFDFTVSGNNAPEVKSYSIDYAPIRK